MEFIKTSGTRYVVDKTKVVKLLDKIKNNISYHQDVDTFIYHNTLKELLAHEIAIKAYDKIKDDIVKLGFIVVTAPTEYFTLECSIGIHNDKLVYGVLDPR